MGELRELRAVVVTCSWVRAGTTQMPSMFGTELQRRSAVARHGKTLLKRSLPVAGPGNNVTSGQKRNSEPY